MASKQRVWGFATAQRDVLMDATLRSSPLLPLICSAERRAEGEHLWLLTGSVRELNEVYDLVEVLMARARGARQRDLLEGLLASLCSAMDRF